MLTPGDLIETPDFPLGNLTVSPSRRLVIRDEQTHLLEPRMMQVLVLLAQNRGQVVSRQRLFDDVWGVPVGEDSLNRAVAGVRKGLELDPEGLMLETIPRSGYCLHVKVEDPGAAPSISRRLVIAGGVGALLIATAGGMVGLSRTAARQREAAELREQGRQRLRESLPIANDRAIEIFERAVDLDQDEAEGWGLLALAYRHRVEYGGADVVTQSMQASERAARRALALDPNEGAALTALATLRPEFGDWLSVERQLLTALERDPDCIPALASLGLIFQSVGRVRDGFEVNDRAAKLDPFNVTTEYRSALKNWILGDVAAADRVLGRALSVWPRHSVFWNTRIVIYAFSGRPRAAREFFDNAPRPTGYSEESGRKWRVALDAIEAKGTPRLASLREELVGVSSSSRLFAVHGVMALSTVGLIDEAFDLAYGYYRGTGPFASTFTRDDGLKLNDMNWRRTMMLFTPGCKDMRADPRFMDLCRDIGLVDYWDKSGTRPDRFLFA